MQVNPEMITVARESRGLTQSELAQKLGVSQGKISKQEARLLEVTPDQLSSLAKVLDYTEELFYQNDPIFGLGPFVFFRSRKSLTVTNRRKIEARANILRMRFKRLQKAVDIESPNHFPRLDDDAYQGGPPEVARRLRQHWSIPTGPINNVVALIESAGGMTFRLPFGIPGVDAVVQCPSGYPPLFLMNGDVTAGERMRLTLAHEIGHAVMRNSLSPDPEKEANDFAAEFLMPESEIGPYLYDLTIPKAITLKPYWKVSLRALVYRAHSLGRIDHRKYRYLIMTINAKYGFDEPEPVPIEKPSLAHEIIELHLNHMNYTFNDLATITFFTSAEKFRTVLYGSTAGGAGLKIVG